MYKSITPTDLIPRGSLWTHIKSGKKYHVLNITNESAKDNDKWPITVVYQDYTGVLWSRPYFGWAKSFKQE